MSSGNAEIGLIELARMDVRHFPTIADAHALIEEFVPEMVALNERPHNDHRDEWLALRDRVEAIFTEGGWTADEGRVTFDLLVAFADVGTPESVPEGDKK